MQVDVSRADLLNPTRIRFETAPGRSDVDATSSRLASTGGSVDGQSKHDEERKTALLVAKASLARALQEDDLAGMVQSAAEIDGLGDDVNSISDMARMWRDLYVAGRRLGSPAIALYACLRVADLLVVTGNPDLSAQQLSTAVDLFPDVGTDPRSQWFDPEVMDQLVVTTLATLYYEHEKYAAVAQVARKIAKQNPEIPVVWFYLGNSLARMKQFPEAAQALNRLTELAPEQPGPHIALSSVLAALGQVDEAISAARRAIGLKPSDLSYRLRLAEICESAGRFDAALTSYGELITLIEQAEPDDPTTPQPRTAAEYSRNMPKRDMDLAARTRRVWILLKAEQWPQAEREAHDLVLLKGHAALIGNQVLGIAAQRQGKHHEALMAIDRHLALCTQAGTDTVQGRLLRAESLAAIDRLDDAVSELDGLCGVGDGFDPKAAIVSLDDLLSRHPGHYGIRKARGQGLLNDFRPRAAIETLSELRDERPDDWQVRAWLGMAMVTSADSDPEWNKGFGTDRILSALSELCTAVLLAPDELYPRVRARWLLERACALPGVRSRLTEVAGLDDAVPEAVQSRRDLNRCWELEKQRAWVQAVSVLTAAKRGAEHAGLKVLVGWCDLRLADNLLRLFEIQGAFDHLAEAERAIGEIGMLPGMIRPLVDRKTAQMQDDGQRMVFEDIDHRQLSQATIGVFLTLGGRLRAEALHRIGDIEGALDAMPAPQSNDVFDDVHLRMMLLRDAGRLREALQLLPTLRNLTKPGDEANAANMAATLYAKLGDVTNAVKMFEATLASPGLHEAMVTTTVGNLLLCYAHQGRHDDVIALSERFPVPAHESIRVRYRRMTTVARALSHKGDHRAAHDTYTTALELADEVRGTIHHEQARMAWHNQYLEDYAHAVRAALAAGATAAALDLVERAKARAFIDRLGARPAQRSAQALHLRTNVERARRRLALLVELSAAEAPGAETDLIDEIQRLRADRNQVNLSNLDGELKAEREALDRLSAALHAEELRGQDSVAGATVSAGDIPTMLGDAILAEYFVLSHQTVLFLLTAEQDVAAVHVIAMGAEHLEKLVPQHLRTVRTLDHEAFRTDFLPFVAPIAEHCPPGATVALVPHGLLHQVPLHALLVERNPVCHLPSASTLRYRRGRAHRAWRTGVVFGDSRGDLPHARHEAAAVAEVFGTTAMLGADATRARLMDRVREPADVIHLACHGRFDHDDPTGSAVLFAPARTEIESQLTVSDVLFDLAINAELVTLSACESGVSAGHPGDELVGLTRALIRAGTPSLIVSLWEVDDLSTAILMTDFYRQVQAGEPLARALSLAQAALAAMSARDVIAHCDAQLAAAPDHTTTSALLLAKAGAQTMAGDLAAALESCREVVRAPATGQAVEALRARAARRIALLQLKGEGDLIQDYDARPFAHPFYWAAFILVGDWR
ncbi:CHAT domain-containing protein [Amycolatopsis japonica]|uniref:CHAT domain-containing protein n=1 Tax=Amycolatopsis japonica TaxID=208439 RepID=UPI003671A524